MTRRLLFLLSLLLVSNTPCTALHKIPPAAAYYKSYAFKQKKICIVSDWDGVIARQKGPLGKGCAALGVLPPKVVWGTFVHNSSSIMGVLGSKGLRDAQGNAVVGTGDSIRFLAQKEPRLAPYYQKLMRVMGHVNPIDTTIDVYQELQDAYDLPIVIWTNTDVDLFIIKYKNCNYRRVCTHKPPLLLDGYFCVGAGADTDSATHYCLVKKPAEEFYEHALVYTRELMHDTDNDWIYLYIDDRARNIAAARSYAQKQKVPLIAVHYTGPQQLKKDLDWLFSMIQSSY